MVNEWAEEPHQFNVGDYVEYRSAPGAVFRVVEQFQTPDCVPLVRIRFVGPSAGVPLKSKRRLQDRFRMKRLTADQRVLTVANPMLVIAIMAEG